MSDAKWHDVANLQKIDEQVIEHFNRSCESKRKELLDKIASIRSEYASISQHHTHSYVCDALMKHSNQIELFKRMMNHYFDTGEIEIPD